MSIAQLNTHRTAAIAALASGDYATAIQNAEAMLLLITAPDVEQGLGSGGGNRSIEMPGGESIEAFITRMERRQNKAASSAGGSSGGVFAQSKVTRARPTA
jgi:hypothetical protein